MAAKTRPTAPFGKEYSPSRGARLLAWLKEHPFDRERIQEQVWRGRLLYREAMRG